MLEGSGYRAVATGPSSFRIEHSPSVAKRRVAPEARAVPADEREPAIIVTALKQSELLSTVPATAEVLRRARLEAATGITDSYVLAREIPSLSITSLGAGRNRLFLRGIGDGPLDGFNQGSVAIVLDEARLNYDAPDPDWALVDIDQVEVLEGPQGPLYGTGALGGIVKISTIRPDPASATVRASASASLSDDDSLSNSQSAVINVPLVLDELAIRGVAYRGEQAGWIKNVGGASHSNRERLAGGRLVIRWLPAKQWTIDVTGAVQNRSARDSQYVDGNLGPLERPSRLREPRDLDAKLAMMTVKGPIGDLELTSVTSFSRQEVVAAYDATPIAALLDAAGPTLVADDRKYSLFDEELRLNRSRIGGLEWLAGLSYIRASTDANIRVDSADLAPLLNLKRSAVEAALFGEAGFAITSKLTIGGGARVFSIVVDDETDEGRLLRSRALRGVKAAAGASLIWNADAGTTVFVRAASGYRPGGINAEPDATQLAYEADELASVELGFRMRIARGVSANATAYAAAWQHVQADELLANGLIATRNAGNAREFGIEGELRWALWPDLALSGGFLVQSARLDANNGVTVIDDLRIPAVPQAAVRMRIDGGFRLGPWKGLASVGVRYTGATHLSFDPLLDRRTGSHAVVDLSATLSRGDWTIELAGDNLTNSRADTFAFGNPFRVRAEAEQTPMRPLTVGFTVSRELH
jgi:iron complex outermembrane receptor protein